jgi:hypothetical protein
MLAERERALHFRKPLVSGYGQFEIRKGPVICACDGRSSMSRATTHSGRRRCSTRSGRFLSRHSLTGHASDQALLPDRELGRLDRWV